MSLLDRYSDFVKERGKKTKVALVGAGQMGPGYCHSNQQNARYGSCSNR